MRSAILFGPPGTSKTTLVRAVADAIGWDYIELHPSHFVSDGLPNVQRRADEIFGRLMELDRCVVLFDEIDELMREREEEPDAFGRFLTTSMLPKLAELWSQRRVVYFVATNHVEHFDQALVRAQRFDALMLVPPPSFDSKRKQLLAIMRDLAPEIEVTFALSKEDVEEAFRAVGSSASSQEPESQLNPEHALAKFVLLRWDQLEELCHYLLRSGGTDRVNVSADSMRAALNQISDRRLKLQATYREFLGDYGRSRRDFSKDLVWRVDGVMPARLKDARYVRQVGDSAWCVVGNKEWLARVAAREGIAFLPAGRVRFADA